MYAMLKVVQRASNPKQYDLEDRTEKFAKEVREFVGNLPHTLTNTDDMRQLLRSSGSIGANYIEANESLGKKDFLMKIKTSRKEARESAYWLRLLEMSTRGNPAWEEARQRLHTEAKELEHIFGAILRNAMAG